MSVFYGGVNHSIPGNGGPDCVGYIPFGQKFMETLVFTAIFGHQVIQTYGKCIGGLPKKFKTTGKGHGLSKTRKTLLAMVTAIIAVELAFKILSRTLIYMLNPCHIVMALQIILLIIDEDSWISCVVFRIHVYMLSGATLAIVFPVLNTRLLPGEVMWYYIQHIVILTIPLYLFSLGGAFTAEPLTDSSWCRFVTGIKFLYHFLFLQFLGNWSQVNLNNMVCPAISDPFRGRLWRVAASVHQSIYIPLHAKLYTVFAHCVVEAFRTLTTPCDTPDKINRQSYCNSTAACNEKMASGDGDKANVIRRSFGKAEDMGIVADRFLKREVEQNGMGPHLTSHFINSGKLDLKMH